MEIDKMLPKGEKIMLKIKYKKQEYIKVITNKSENRYYEISDGGIKLVEDPNLLEHFKNMYEIKESDIIYQ